MSIVISKWPFNGFERQAHDFDVERAYDIISMLRIPILLLDAIYVIFVCKFADKLVAFKPKRLLLRDISILWNGMNSLLSLYMFICLLPEFLTSLSNGWYYTICKRGTFYIGYYSGHAMFLFCLSKMWELGDTVLLALRGRQIIFLHSFHHAIVLIQVSFTYYTAGSMARIGTVMNCFVHSIMYGYFAIQNIVPSVRQIAFMITILQLAQFVVACIGMISLASYVLSGYQCDTEYRMIPVHFVIYAAFLALFLNFYFKSYVNKEKPKSEHLKRRSNKQHQQ
ncbi:hypothetical protein M3Y96_00712700 [Aphelenchoides besseyi]|nr:hypothetical protein M3Y96_00712700 [Aphelenchoides besseyi]